MTTGTDAVAGLPAPSVAVTVICFVTGELPSMNGRAKVAVYVPDPVIGKFTPSIVATTEATPESASLAVARTVICPLPSRNGALTCGWVMVSVGGAVSGGG